MEPVGKIIFYQDHNFQGDYFECSSDCPELNSHLRRCNSVRVKSGAWVLFERPNYLGNQYVLTKGEYPDFRQRMGLTDSVRSCHVIPNVSGAFRIRVFEHPDFAGQMLECTQDVTQLSDLWYQGAVHSAQVQDGAWVFYDLPNYRGHQYLLERGQYRRYTEWAAMDPTVGSLRRVLAV
ncbi:gamma-crystallin B-like [Dunckerocampus dactyliophorus]|uniref:gamma-crystallin B-like n=1 Tax=Dunckerocampus dactyliophorus TaxID=161453 RepID=UPI0024055DF2|nr:gamma-crystallin B-like [Dunckerocampus dactyliophorus]